jgi:hypothetical protein
MESSAVCRVSPPLNAMKLLKADCLVMCFWQVGWILLESGWSYAYGRDKQPEANKGPKRFRTGAT